MISGPVFKKVNFLRNLQMDAISSSVTFYIRLQRHNRDKNSGLLSIFFWKMKRCQYDPWSLRMNHAAKRDKNLKYILFKLSIFWQKSNFHSSIESFSPLVVKICEFCVSSGFVSTVASWEEANACSRIRACLFSSANFRFLSIRSRCSSLSAVFGVCWLSRCWNF